MKRVALAGWNEDGGGGGGVGGVWGYGNDMSRRKVHLTHCRD